MTETNTVPHTAATPIERAVTRVLDFILPPLCLSCDKTLGSDQALCAECWGKINFIAAPLCARCGTPFDVPVGAGVECGACIAEPPNYTLARSVMVYDEGSKRLILGFKHADHIHGARVLGRWLQRVGAEILGHADCIIPVPLHRWRLFHRRYNQSALLAQALGKISGKTVLVDALRRVRATETQGHLGRKERAENVHNAFSIAPGAAQKMAGKNLVLIDDVLTTGATVNECARVLQKAGAAQVMVLTIARVKGRV